MKNIIVISLGDDLPDLEQDIVIGSDESDQIQKATALVAKILEIFVGWTESEGWGERTIRIDVMQTGKGG